MNCCSCKRKIESNSLYCNWCGAKQVRIRKKRDVIDVPQPQQLSSGTWFLRFMYNGKRISVSDSAKDLCIAKAIAIKADLIQNEKASSRLKLEDACKRYIADRSSILSPSTLNGYDTILATRFIKWLSVDIYSRPNWQSMINEEARICSPKTLKNAWGFISSALRYNGVDPGTVVLPQVVKKELPWLDFDQILTFLSAIEGKPGELAALLALHSLRKSEILGLTASRIDLLSEPATITVQGSAVIGVGNKLVYKESNKNKSSQRTIPIVIPRLKTLLTTACAEHADGPLITCNPNTMHGQINAVCERAGLPLTGLHGLRRSFASLAYHLGWSELETMRFGGWSDFRTMREIYTKLSQKDLTASVEKMTRFYANNGKIANEIANDEKKTVE